MANNITNNNFFGKIIGNTFSGSGGVNNVSVGTQDITGNSDFSGYSFQQDDVAAGLYILNADGAGIIDFTPYSPSSGGGGLYEGYTFSQFQNQMKGAGLTAGAWYNIYGTSSNSPSSGRTLTFAYDLFVFATGTNSIAPNGKRRMRVPKQSLYSSSYYYKSLPSSGNKCVVSNWVYNNLANAQGTLDYYTTPDTTNWSLVDPSDSTYYETRIYEVLLDTDPNLPEGYFLRIAEQWDERHNHVNASPTQSSFATNASTGFALNGEWQTTCDLNEWNNPLLKDNSTYGVWANWSFDSGSSTRIEANKVFFYRNRETSSITDINAEPFINNNAAYLIGGNEVQEKAIRDNTGVERIVANKVVGYIKGNTGGDFYAYNEIEGVFDSSSTNYGIVDNDASDIAYNKAASIGGNVMDQTGGNTGRIIGNVLNFGKIENNVNGDIIGNMVTGDISSNSNTGEISGNRMSGDRTSAAINGTIRAIWNNGSGVSDIIDNDCFSITGNG